MTYIDLNLLTLVVGTASLVLLLIELRSNHLWNQKRTSYELMNEMITSGRMTGALNALCTDFGWDILNDSQTYAEVAARIPQERLAELDGHMVVIMRHLEMLSISIAHGIVSERICRDGFWSFFLKIHCGAESFIEKERIRRNTRGVYEKFECYALRWQGKPLPPPVKPGEMIKPAPKPAAA